MIKTGTPMQGRVYLNTKAIKCDCEKCVHYSKKKHYCGTVCEWSPNREKYIINNILNSKFWI